MVGVDVGQLNVNQEQNLNLKQKIMIRMERSQLNTTYSLTSDTSHLWNESNHDRDYIKKATYYLPLSSISSGQQIATVVELRVWFYSNVSVHSTYLTSCLADLLPNLKLSLVLICVEQMLLSPHSQEGEVLKSIHKRFWKMINSSFSIS